MFGMEGVHWIKNASGKLAEIRVDVTENPELAKEVYHLIQALSRAKGSERAKAYRDSSRVLTSESIATDTSSSDSHLTKLVREAKASGEMSQEQFFQRFPTWQSNAT